MKAIHIVLIVLTAVVGSAAYVVFRPAAPQPEPPPAVWVEQVVAQVEEAAPVAAPVPVQAPAVEEQPAQPLEERGDAMLFEIDALGSMPFDEPITRPFD